MDGKDVKLIGGGLGGGLGGYGGLGGGEGGLGGGGGQNTGLETCRIIPSHPPPVFATLIKSGA